MRQRAAEKMVMLFMGTKNNVSPAKRMYITWGADFYDNKPPTNSRI